MVLENLIHYRDFLSTKQISRIIFFMEKKYSGVINIGSGKTDLRGVAKFFGNKYKKKFYLKKINPHIILLIYQIKKIRFKK